MKHHLRGLLAFEPLVVLAVAPCLVLREWAPIQRWPLLPEPYDEATRRLLETEGTWQAAFAYVGTTVSWIEVMALAVLAALWPLRRWVTGRWSVRTAIDLPVLALLATLPFAISAAWDGHRPAAISRAESLLVAIALAYAVANAVTSRRRAHAAAIGVMMVGLALATAGLLSVEWPEKLPRLAAMLEHVPRLATTVPHATLRAPAHPNQLAGLMVVVIPLALGCWRGLGLPRRRPRRRGGDTPSDQVRAIMPRSVRRAAVVTFFCTLCVLLLSQSRGAMISLLAAMLGSAWIGALRDAAEGEGRHRGKRWRPVVVPVVLAGGLLLALIPVLAGNVFRTPLPPPPSMNLASETRTLHFSARSRVFLWGSSLEMLEQDPLRGIGLHNFVWRQANREENEGLLIYPGFSHAHNVLLQAALDYGLPGAVAVAGLAGALARTALRARKRLEGSSLQHVVSGSAVGLLAYALHGLVDAVAVGAKPGFLVWSVAGLLVGLDAHASRLVGANSQGQRGARGVRSASRGASISTPSEVFP